MKPHLVIVGASVRAAAQSAVRASFDVSGIDLFADQDLAECATAVHCDDYPRGLAKLAEGAADGPWMYTGALENYPRLVDRIAAKRKLLGNPGEVLRRVRDPLLLHRAISESGLPCPDVRVDPTEVPRDGSWLMKPRRSGGGTNVRRFTGQIPRGAVYYQRFIAGTPASATYVAARSKAVLIGVTEQLIGAQHISGENFRYIGSIGPIALSPAIMSSLKDLGNTIARGFALTGLFGIDGIVADDAFWPIEVNPRYTASMELLERAIDRSLVGDHVAAATSSTLPLAFQSNPNILYGKTIAFATKDFVVDHSLAEFAEKSRNTDTTLADIPPPGTHVAAGSPIATACTRGTSRDMIMRNLRATVKQLLAVVDA
jgi:uncharacterized protein